MELTAKQEKGLKIAVERHRMGEKYTVIAGYAGTGKSTLVKFIVEALQVEPSRVCYATFTGKAAEVLRKKGNKNACTLHRLLYEHIPLPAGGFYRKPKDMIPYDIVVIDEISMVPKSLVDVLFRHKCYIICLGDPFQLPPIDKDEDNHLLDKPHIFLDQIMRQAEDSEIIRLSMDIREYKPINLMDGANVKVMNKADLSTGMLTWADQVLVATNAERVRLNTEMRKLYGKGPLPEEGDKVICLRNYWDDFSVTGDPLVNGTIGYLSDPVENQVYIPYFVRSSVDHFDTISTAFKTSEDIYYDLNLDKNMIINGEKCCDWRLSYQLGKLKNKIGDIVPKEFAYGYAITVHKAQGSEWDKVLVLEERFPFDKEEHARWLYTAVTRASDKLVLLR